MNDLFFCLGFFVCWHVFSKGSIMEDTEESIKECDVFKEKIVKKKVQTKERQ